MLFPGLCGDAAAANFRLFLGTHPALSVEQRLLRQLHAVYPWYASRKRVKEAANEFVELDQASIDAETMMRYSHVFFVRRQIYEDTLEKQMTMLENTSAKPPKAADVAVTQCLGDINASINKQVQRELASLAKAKRSCNVAGRRELEPDAPLHNHDLLCMMRIAEEDLTPDLVDVESQCRGFLPADRVHEAAARLASDLLGADNMRKELDKKDQRLWSRMHPTDYNKIGCIEKYRPIDVSAYYRFFGERTVKSTDAFSKSMWGNVFRQFAADPGYLCGMSRYWSLHSGLDTKPSAVTLPVNLAQAACRQQNLFPALKLRTMYLYTSPEVARQLWRVEPFVPLMRLYPLLGHAMSEETIAAILVEDFWSSLRKSSPDVQATSDTVIRAVRQFVEECCQLREGNLDLLLTKTSEAAARAIPLPATPADGVSGEENTDDEAKA